MTATAYDLSLVAVGVVDISLVAAGAAHQPFGAASLFFTRLIDYTLLNIHLVISISLLVIEIGACTLVYTCVLLEDKMHMTAQRHIVEK